MGGKYLLFWKEKKNPILLTCTSFEAFFPFNSLKAFIYKLMTVNSQYLWFLHTYITTHIYMYIYFLI